MNKLELVTALKDKTGVSKVEAAKIVKTFFDTMADTLATGERVEVRGLCSFFCQGIQELHRQKPENRRKSHHRSQETSVFQMRKRA